jgi:hypothetical protein
MLERAREVTRNGKYTYIEYARFAGAARLRQGFGATRARTRRCF